MQRLLTTITMCTCMVLAGCGGNNILHNADTSASHIEMSLNISVGENGKNLLDFILTQNNIWVGLDHGETMICNTIPIDKNPDRNGFEATDFPLATTTTPITCQYSSTSAPVSFTFTPIPPPQLSTPLPPTHDHTQPLDIVYTPINGTEVQTRSFVYSNGKRKLMDTKMQPDTGHLTLDVHNLQGTGGVELKRIQSISLPNSGFHSLDIYLDTTVSIPIVLI